MRLGDVDTPALILDRERLSRNTGFMLRRARAAGVGLRPHMKTAKSARIAELATSAQFRAVTVSTLAEAEYFLDHGYPDITYAICMVPGRLARAADLVRRGASLRWLADDESTLRELAARAVDLDVRFSVLIEIDCGEHRTGVAWDGAELLACAAVICASSHLSLSGVLTHGGHSYECTTIDQIARVASDERAAVVGAAERLSAAGYDCPVISAGSTPTAVHAADFSGLTEIRPGVYMFYDLVQHSLGVCRWQDIAISVLATVISHQPAYGRLIIDAGGLALSRDTGARDRLARTGHGWIVDATGQHRIGDLHVAIADQEHGYVEGQSIPYDRLPVGSRVRVLPGHACMTAAAHTRYLVVDGASDHIDEVWDRINGW